ncbi:Membrane protease subunits, stomatin/prohibitin homologs [Streptomyces sp. AmelKG-D3]|nr:SPFH domain-containing protein [Streptomyces sp. SID8350]SCK45213.1 Membrane protease subunits, stomatin/prohibitin homologs [Streptomyces sp. AmelKG-D3]
MPLVDGVALHQPPAATPPPLFRPREERSGAEEGAPATASASGPPLDLDPDLGSDAGPPEAAAPVSGRDPLLDLHLDLDRSPVGEGPGAPTPALDPAPDLAWDSASASALAPAPDLARGLAPDSARDLASAPDPARGLASELDPDLARGPASALDPASGLDLVSPPSPDSVRGPASAQALAPDPARESVSVPDLDLFVGLDPTPSRTGAGGTSPGRDLGLGPDLDARPGGYSRPGATDRVASATASDPRVTGKSASALDARGAGGSGPAQAQAQASGPRGAGGSAPAPAPGSAPDPDPGPGLGPASPPGSPLPPVSLEHPGRSPRLGQGEAEVPEPADRSSFRPVSGAKRADGLGLFRPVRRPRTEPSGEWTPLPAYGEEAGHRPAPAPAAQADRARSAAETGAGADAVAETGTAAETGGDAGTVAGTGAGIAAVAGAEAQDADKATGAQGAPAPTPSLSVPAPQPPPHSRRHALIAGESTAAIPVHLLFRDDDAPRRTEPTALPTSVARQGAHTAPAPSDRAPRPRSPHHRVEPATRPAPLADPRLAERPGPALSGYAALLTGAAGLLGGLALLWWRGALPVAVQSTVGLTPRPYEGIGAGVWAGLALLVTAVVLALGGLGRGRVGHAWVLTLFGDYRGTVRRTGLVWISPILLRRRVDVRLRHWRSEPLPAVDANGTALRVVVLVVWRIKDTVRAALGIEDHEAYLSAQVESAMARVLSQLPADAFHEDAPTLRDAEAVGDALTRMLKADCEPVGVEVYSAQPTGIEYAPEVAAAMQRRRIAAIDAKHRDSVLTSVVDAVDDTVNRLTTRGIVELDDYERKALVKDLTVAFYTGRSAGGDGA